MDRVVDAKNKSKRNSATFPGSMRNLENLKRNLSDGARRKAQAITPNTSTLTTELQMNNYSDEVIKPRKSSIKSAHARPPSFLSSYASIMQSSKQINGQGENGRLPLNIQNIGRDFENTPGTVYQFLCESESERRAWQDCITSQQLSVSLNPKRNVFRLECITNDYFYPSGTLIESMSGISCEILSTSIYEDFLIACCDVGVYIGKLANNTVQKEEFKKILDFDRVAQIEILRDLEVILFLHEKTLYSISIDILEGEKNPQKLLAKKISSHVAYFKTGICCDQFYMCAVKSTTLSTTIKVYEPIADRKKTAIFGLKIHKEAFKLLKEFYIPSESSAIIYLKTKLCVACAKGFEIIDLFTLATQSILDPKDPNLAILANEELVAINVFRTISGEFMLCYNSI